MIGICRWSGDDFRVPHARLDMSPPATAGMGALPPACIGDPLLEDLTVRPPKKAETKVLIRFREAIVLGTDPDTGANRGLSKVGEEMEVTRWWARHWVGLGIAEVVHDPRLEANKAMARAERVLEVERAIESAQLRSKPHRLPPPPPPPAPTDPVRITILSGFIGEDLQPHNPGDEVACSLEFALRLVEHGRAEFCDATAVKAMLAAK